MCTLYYRACTVPACTVPVQAVPHTHLQRIPPRDLPSFLSGSLTMMSPLKTAACKRSTHCGTYTGCAITQSPALATPLRRVGRPERWTKASASAPALRLPPSVLITGSRLHPGCNIPQEYQPSPSYSSLLWMPLELRLLPLRLEICKPSRPLHRHRVKRLLGRSVCLVSFLGSCRRVAPQIAIIGGRRRPTDCKIAYLPLLKLCGRGIVHWFAPSTLHAVVKHRLLNLLGCSVCLVCFLGSCGCVAPQVAIIPQLLRQLCVEGRVEVLQQLARLWQHTRPGGGAGQDGRGESRMWVEGFARLV